MRGAATLGSAVLCQTLFAEQLPLGGAWLCAYKQGRGLGSAGILAGGFRPTNGAGKDAGATRSLEC
jgi:hypothetical protein